MPSSLDNLEEAIKKLQDMYDDPDIVIPASQLPEKPNPYKDFMDRNPMMDGGMLVQPSADGRRPGYDGRKNRKVSYDTENKIVREYNTYLCLMLVVVCLSCLLL